jgi:hypothetical protein
MMEHVIDIQRDARAGKSGGFTRPIRPIRPFGPFRPIHPFRGSLFVLDHGCHGCHGFPPARPRLIRVKPSQTQSNHQPKITNLGSVQTSDYSCWPLVTNHYSLATNLVAQVVDFHDHFRYFRRFLDRINPLARRLRRAGKIPCPLLGERVWASLIHPLHSARANPPDKLRFDPKIAPYRTLSHPSMGLSRPIAI